MFHSCSIFDLPKPPVAGAVQALKVREVTRKQREAVITAIALVVVATVLLTACIILARISLFPPEQLMGMGIFLYLPGAWLGMVGVGVGVGAAGFSLLALYRTYQKTQWESARVPHILRPTVSV